MGKESSTIKAQVHELAKPLKKNDYGKYLLSL